MRPLQDYLKLQTRFKAISAEQVRAMQERIDRKWENYRQQFGAE
jgi:pyruvate ferredoxin oxidoreductase beta subunit